MRAPKFMALLMMVALPLLIACEARERTEMAERGGAPTQTAEQEVPGTQQPNDLNPLEAQTMVDDVTIGHQAGADGTIPAEHQGDDFAPGDSVVLSMKVEDAPAGSAVKVVWYGPGEMKIKEEQKSVNPGDQYLTFQAANTGDWQKGDYRAEIWIGDEKVNQQQFQIVDDTEAGK